MENGERSFYADEWGGHPPDGGCNVAPSCLRCPLAVCKHDLGPREYATIRQQRRRAAMVDLVRSGLSQGEAAAASGVSIRTVSRAMGGP